MASIDPMRILSTEELPGDCSFEITPVDAIKQVLDVSGSELRDVFKKVQGPPGNPVQAVTAWWMVSTTGLQKKEVAKRLKMSNAGVGRALRRVRSEPVRNPGSDIAAWSQVLIEQRQNTSIQE